MVTRLLPAGAGAAARVAEAVIDWAEASDTPDEWTVHGDLYENQVLVAGNRLTLIDLDDVGPGDPLLDAANFSAHLLLLATSGAPAGGLIGRYRVEIRAASARAFDVAPAELAWREAYCLLRLVSGPFRVLHPAWPARLAARLKLAVEALSV
jgi:aminoglycoside phosphotransferase (APT) family kinase protein